MEDAYHRNPLVNVTCTLIDIDGIFSPMCDLHINPLSFIYNQSPISTKSVMSLSVNSLM